jgi:hypothetical protein
MLKLKFHQFKSLWNIHCTNIKFHEVYGTKLDRWSHRINYQFVSIHIIIWRIQLIRSRNCWPFANTWAYMNYIATSNAEIKIPPIQKPVKCTLYQYQIPTVWTKNKSWQAIVVMMVVGFTTTYKLVVRVTRQVPTVEQEPRGVRVAQSLVFCVVFCKTLYGHTE